MANILVLSFDGIAVENDVHGALYERFAGPGLADISAARAAGNLSSEEFHARALALVEAGEDDVQAFAGGHAVLRPGLTDLVRWAESRDWLPLLLSDGIDQVVDPVLDSAGLGQVARRAGRARRQYRWRVRYVSPRGIELAAGFVLSYVRAFRAAGDFVAFAGSRAADGPAAAAATAALTRGPLTATLRDLDHIHPFDTLADIIDLMDRLAAGWLDPPRAQSSGR